MAPSDTHPDDETFPGAPPLRSIEKHFPWRQMSPQELATRRADGQMWRTTRELAGYPELEWSHPLSADRVVMFDRSIPGYFYEPISSFETARVILAVNATLEPQHVASCPHLVVGFRYFDSAYYARDGQLKMPGRDDPFRGQHLAIGVHMGEDELGFVGWRPDWGNNGYGKISREYFDAHVLSMYASWSVVGGPSRRMGRCLEKRHADHSPHFDDLIACWATPNSYQEDEEEIAGQRLRLLHWEVISLETDRPVDVVEIAAGDAPVGRVHVFHELEKCTIRELVVRPDWRRRGIGSFLEDFADDRARLYEHDRIEAWLMEDDARPRCRGAAEGFGTACGYAWDQVEKRLPLVSAVGTKELN